MIESQVEWRKKKQQLVKGENKDEENRTDFLQLRYRTTMTYLYIITMGKKVLC